MMQAFRSAVAVLVLFISMAYASDSSNWKEFDLKPGTIEFSGEKKVSKITLGDSEVLIGNCEVVGDLVGSSMPSYQKWGNSAEATNEENALTITSTINADDKSGGDEVIKAAVSFKKVEAGQFDLNVEATYLKAADWKLPAYYFLMFPVKTYEGGTLTGEGGSGGSRTFQIESTPSGLNGNIFRKVTLVKGDVRITIESADLSKLRVMDGRAWGDKNIRIDIFASRKWAPVQHIESGEKDVFGARITLQRNKK